jgi:hypothetical protein
MDKHSNLLGEEKKFKMLTPKLNVVKNYDSNLLMLVTS